MKLPGIAYLAIILFSISAIAIFSGDASITGKAIATVQDGQKMYGNYSIKPHFTVKAAHPIERYKDLRVSARELLQEVRKCQGPLETCIVSSIQTLQLDWKISCGQERFYLDTADLISRCRASKTNDCLCSLDMSQLDDGIHLISLRNFEGSTLLESSLTQSASIPGSISLMREADGLADFISPALISLDLVKAGSPKLSILVNDKSSDLGQKLVLYKRDPDLAILPPDSGFGAKPLCEMPERRTYAFCAPDASGRSYRFALYFESENADDDKTPAALGPDQ